MAATGGPAERPPHVGIRDAAPLITRRPRPPARRSAGRSRSQARHPRLPALHPQFSARGSALGVLALIAALLGVLTGHAYPVHVVPAATSGTGTAATSGTGTAADGHFAPRDGARGRDAAGGRPGDRPDHHPATGHPHDGRADATRVAAGHAGPQHQVREQHAPGGPAGGTLPAQRTTAPCPPAGAPGTATAGGCHGASPVTLPDVRGPPTTGGREA